MQNVQNNGAQIIETDYWEGHFYSCYVFQYFRRKMNSLTNKYEYLLACSCVGTHEYFHGGAELWERG